MANEKYSELLGMSDEELQTELKEMESQLQKLEFDHVTTGLEDPTVIRISRREIARIKTAIRDRQIKAMTPEEVEGRSKIRARRRK